MTLERNLKPTIFYAIESAFKALVAYFVYCGLLSFTKDSNGSVYIATAVFIVLIILKWDTPESLAEKLIPEEEEP